ncbi:MAG: LacI family DNA-binding transcriptional regulator [Paraburkholderia hospita]
MSHPFLIKEIALQAGLGMATVDRLLSGRAHVREHTPRRIRQAIGEREEQQLTIATSGRKLVVDVVVEAPRRFVDEIRDALEDAAPDLHRPRFLMQETMTTPENIPHDVIARFAARP